MERISSLKKSASSKDTAQREGENMKKAAEEAYKQLAGMKDVCL